MKDEVIIQHIKDGEHERAIRALYPLFPKMKSVVVRNGGNETDARAIFHDSLILMLEKVEKPEFILTSKLSTFLIGIGNFLWKNEMRKRGKETAITLSEEMAISTQLEYDREEEDKLTVMENVLTQISEKCQRIIELFYFRKRTMAEIAEKLEFSSVNSAKTQKYKCIERASKLAKGKSLTYSEAL